MNTGVGRAQVGQWYTRWDRGEIFRVTGYNASSRMIEVQTFDGDLAGIDLETWVMLPLGLAEPPEDWTQPVDDVENSDLARSETAIIGAQWIDPLQLVTAAELEEEDEELGEEETEEEEFAQEGPSIEAGSAATQPLRTDSPGA